MPHQIQIDKDSEFFIAICKYGVHSYVSLGVKAKNEAPFFLASFGKILYSDSEAPSGLKACCETIFWHSDAAIQNERLTAHERSNETFRTPGRAEVQYKAYGITYQHYIQFLQYMAEVAKKQQNQYLYAPTLKAFTVVEEDEHKAKLEWRRLTNKPASTMQVDAGENCLAFGNTCRHSAIRFTEQAKQVPGMGEGISSSFFRAPPLKAVFSAGYVSKAHHFYILPLPPTTFTEIEGEKKHILIKLYKRLDKMVLIAQDNPLSIKKFEELKTLYQDIATKLPANLLEVIASIESWESEHQELIKSHRENHWFHFSTATEDMFETFHQRFSRIKEQSVQADDFHL